MHTRGLTSTTLRASSVVDDLMMVSYFPQKTGFDISCKLSPNLHEMYKPVFRENKKDNSKCRLLIFLPCIPSVNSHVMKM